MSFTQFDASSDIVQPAITYDKYWLNSLSVQAMGYPKARLTAEFVPCRDTETGKEIKPNPLPSERKRIVVDNVFELAAEINELAIAMESVFQALKVIGLQKCIFKNTIEQQ